MKKININKDTAPKEKIPGGLAKNKTVGDLARLHKQSVGKIIKELIKGVSTELEHTDSTDVALEIAFDHVYEDPEYYSKLKQIES